MMRRITFISSQAVKVSMAKAMDMPMMKKMLASQLPSWKKVNVMTKARISTYTSQRKGSRIRLISSYEMRRVFSGEMLRMEISGSNAKRMEITIPNSIPCPMASQDVVVEILSGRKSFITTGKIC